MTPTHFPPPGPAQPTLTLGDSFVSLLLANSPMLGELIDQRAENKFRQLQAQQQAANEAAEQSQKLVDKHEAAAELKVAPQTIWTYYSKGELPGEMCGNRILFRLGNVRALLKAKTLPDGRRKYARRATNEKSR